MSRTRRDNDVEPGMYPVLVKRVEPVIQALHGFRDIPSSYVLVLVLMMVCCNFARYRAGSDIDENDGLFQQFLIMMLPGADMVSGADGLLQRGPMEIPTMYQVAILLRFSPSIKFCWPLKGFTKEQERLFTAIVGAVIEWQYQSLTYAMVGLNAHDGRLVQHGVAWCLVEIYYGNSGHTRGRRPMEKVIIEALTRIVYADVRGTSFMRRTNQINPWEVFGGPSRKNHTSAAILAGLLKNRHTTPSWWRELFHYYVGFMPGDVNRKGKPEGCRYTGLTYWWSGYLALTEPHIAGKTFNMCVRRMVGYWWLVVWGIKLVNWCSSDYLFKIDNYTDCKFRLNPVRPIQGTTYANWKTCAEETFPYFIMEAFLTVCVPVLLICVECWLMMQIPGSFREMLRSSGNGFKHTSCGLLRRLIDTTRLSPPVGRLRNGMIVNAVFVLFGPLWNTLWNIQEVDKYVHYLYGYSILFLLLFGRVFHFFKWGVWAKKKETEEPAFISLTYLFLAIVAWYMTTWSLFTDNLLDLVRVSVLVPFVGMAISPTDIYDTKNDKPKIGRCQRYFQRYLKFWVNFFSVDCFCNMFMLFFVVYVYVLMNMTFDQKDNMEGWCAMIHTYNTSYEVMGLGQKALNYVMPVSGQKALNFMVPVAMNLRPTALGNLRFLRFWLMLPVLGLAGYFLWYTCLNWTDKYNVIGFMKLVGYNASEYKNAMGGAIVVGALGIWSLKTALSYWTNYDALDCDMLQMTQGSLRVQRNIFFTFVPYEWRMMGAYAHICMIGVTWSTIWAWNLFNDTEYCDYEDEDEDEDEDDDEDE